MKYSLRLFHLLFLFTISIAFGANAQKVGIGTTTPSDALHVRSNVAEDPLRVQVGSSTKLRVFNHGGTSIGANNASGTPANGLYVNGNTGLGVGNPSEKLSVAGDINFTGQLKTDGNAGAQGQILTADGNGDMQWTDLTRFENFKSFSNPGINTWTIPADVTEILIELWGAGGGGSPGGGGGAGGYVIALFELNTQGGTYTFNIGAGGTGATQPNGQSTGGGTSTVTGPGISFLTAKGGLAIIGNTSPGLGGGAAYLASYTAISRNGEHGHSNELSFDQYGTSSFARVIQYGQGGQSYTGGKGGHGGAIAEDVSTNSVVFSSNGRPGVSPGGGGGGGFNNNGADGFAIIRW